MISDLICCRLKH